MNDPTAVLATLAESPDWFCHQIDLDADRALLVRLEPEAIRAAAFLDERVLAGRSDGFRIPLATLRERAQACVGHAPHAIFHIGHCGSTLLARVLGELPGVRVLREPLAAAHAGRAVRGIAAGDRTHRRAAMAGTGRRGAGPHGAARGRRRDAGVLAKATSNCNALIDPWLARASAGARAAAVGGAARLPRHDPEVAAGARRCAALRAGAPGLPAPLAWRRCPAPAAAVDGRAHRAGLDRRDRALRRRAAAPWRTRAAPGLRRLPRRPRGGAGAGRRALRARRSTRLPALAPSRPRCWIAMPRPPSMPTTRRRAPPTWPNPRAALRRSWPRGWRSCANVATRYPALARLLPPSG